MDAGKIRPKPSLTLRGWGRLSNEGHGFSCQVYKMSPDIVYSFVFSSPCLAAAEARAQPTLQPYRTDWVGEGFSQMGKRLLTKGTASAVP
jgi:hypothetical protein